MTGDDRTISRVLVASGLVGLTASIALRFVDGPGAAPVARIVALAVLAATPLALAASRVARSASRRLRIGIAVAQPVAAICAVASLWAEGSVAWQLASAWVVVGVLVALLGRGPLYTRAGWRDPATVCDSLALLYFPVGTLWLVVSRAGLTPFDLPPTIVELTIVHFHYAGLGALVLAARSIATVSERPLARRVAGLAGLGTAIGIPIVATGITLSPAIGLVGTILLAGSLVVHAIVSLAVVVRLQKSALARVLTIVSALSLLLSMPLAILYSLGEVTGETHVLLDSMVRYHGFANAHGVVVCGLLAWIAEDRAERRSATRTGPPAE